LIFGVDEVAAFSASFPQVCGTHLRADYSRIAVQARRSTMNVPECQNTDHDEASTCSTCYSTNFTAGETVGFFIIEEVPVAVLDVAMVLETATKSKRDKYRGERSRG